MITIVHGDDLSSSREFYVSEKQKVNDPISLDGKSISVSNLTLAFEGDSLFFEHKDIFIENLFAGRKTNTREFKELAEFINLKHKEFNIFLFEDKELTKSNTGTFDKAVVKQFNLPQVLFSFLDGIKPNSKQNLVNFHLLLKNTEVEMVFFMLVRQFRLLLALSDTNSTQNIEELKRLAPWQQGKLKSQSRLFGDVLLKKIYKQLFKMDLGLKSGTLSTSLEQAIDIFLLEI